MEAVSAFATIDGGPRTRTTNESNIDECGATHNIGASFADAFVPLNLMKLNDPAK